MHTDARTLEDGALIEGDLCIVGAGAAGISMAMEWIGTPYTVILLEGGGFNYEPQMQALYAGKSIGDPYQAPLEVARLHYFGGTTGHWAGWCAPMDPINFQKRDWVPHIGWPFQKEHLDPFYERAQAYVELGPYVYDAADYEAKYPPQQRLPFDEEKIWTKMWQFSPPTRFGTRYRDTIIDAENLHLYTYANVTEIEANESVRAVAGLRTQTIDGKRHRVRARRYVLSCGSIQNARILLASNAQAPAGLGNDHDLVGRFFMEHFEMGGAQLILEKPDPMPMYAFRLGGERPPSGELALTEQAQRKHRILNGTASLRPGTFPEEMRSFFQRFSEGALGQRMRSDEQEGEEPQRPPNRPAASDEGRRDYRLQSRAEQMPNPASRVMLSTEKDALGMPYADLHWKLSELDKRSMRTFFEIVAHEFGRTGLGRVQILDWLLEDDTTWPSFLSGGFHHMGTTRMHEDPKQGVLDTNAKVHSLENLYVAGASAFPTSGAPNPTLTLIALSLRLSDHLKHKTR